MERMKQSITQVLAFCVIASSAFANLGADSERIEDAYGTIVQRRLRDDGTVSVVYAKDRYLYMGRPLWGHCCGSGPEFGRFQYNVGGDVNRTRVFL